MADKSLIIDTIAKLGASVSGINAEAVYGPGGAVAGVKQLPEDIGAALPAFMVLDAGGPIIPGNWERQTWNLEGSIWVEYEPRGERYKQIVDLAEPTLAAFRNTAEIAARAVDTAVQSVLIVEFRAIEGRQWHRRENAPWYLVLPFVIEVKVNRAVAYVAA